MNIKVLETNILHASDVIYWLDGSSAETNDKMLRINKPLSLQLTTRPKDLVTVHKAGKTSLMRRPLNEIVSGTASEADKHPALTDTYLVEGIISDPVGYFVSRKFKIDAGNGAGHGIVIYPTPLGSRFGAAGGLTGTLRYDSSDDPVPWAIIKLVVTVGIGHTITFRSQATGLGDFSLSLYSLPPLPEGTDYYSAKLSISGRSTASDHTPIDPDALPKLETLKLKRVEGTGTGFLNAVSVNVVPGDIRSLQSNGRDYVAVLHPE